MRKHPVLKVGSVFVVLSYVPSPSPGSGRPDRFWSIFKHEYFLPAQLRHHRRAPSRDRPLHQLYDHRHRCGKAYYLSSIGYETNLRPQATSRKTRVHYFWAISRFAGDVYIARASTTDIIDIDRKHCLLEAVLADHWSDAEAVCDGSNYRTHPTRKSTSGGCRD